MISEIRSRIFRVLRIAVLVLALILGAQWVRNAFTAVESEQAVINAEIVQIRTPITGELEMTDLRPGMLRHKGERLFTVRNPRFGDRESVAQYNNIQNTVELQKGEILGAKQSLETARISRGRVQRQYKAQLIARVQVEDEEKRFSDAEKLLHAKEEQLARTEARAREMEEQMKMTKESVVLMPIDGVI